VNGVRDIDEKGSFVVGIAERARFSETSIHTNEASWFAATCSWCGAQSKYKRGFKGLRRFLRKWREAHACAAVVTAIDVEKSRITIEDA